jgi:hypothetical protein
MHIIDAMILLYPALPRYCTIYNQYAKFLCRFYLNLGRCINTFNNALARDTNS